MFVIRIGTLYISQFLPKVELVEYREDVKRQCLFAEISHAEGMQHILSHSSKFKTDLIDIIHYTKATRKYHSCTIDTNAKHVDVKWKAGSKDVRCDICKIITPSVPSLLIGNRTSVCSFCLQRMNDAGVLKLEKVTQEVKDDYFAILLCNNLSSFDEPTFEEIFDDIPF